MKGQSSFRGRFDPLVPLASVAIGLTACDGPSEAPRVELPVFTDSTGIEPVTNDLGYLVTLDEARMVARDFEFAVSGEVHTTLGEQLLDLFVSVAHAHPGHYLGGEALCANVA